MRPILRTSAIVMLALLSAVVWRPAEAAPPSEPAAINVVSAIAVANVSPDVVDFAVARADAIERHERAFTDASPSARSSPHAASIARSDVDTPLNSVRATSSSVIEHTNLTSSTARRTRPYAKGETPHQLVYPNRTITRLDAYGRA